MLAASLMASTLLFPAKITAFLATLNIKLLKPPPPAALRLINPAIVFLIVVESAIFTLLQTLLHLIRILYLEPAAPSNTLTASPITIH